MLARNYTLLMKHSTLPQFVKFFIDSEICTKLDNSRTSFQKPSIEPPRYYERCFDNIALHSVLRASAGSTEVVRVAGQSE